MKIQLLSYMPDSILSWFFDHGIKILLILIGAFVVHKFSCILIDQGIRKAVTSDRSISLEA